MINVIIREIEKKLDKIDPKYRKYVTIDALKLQKDLEAPSIPSGNGKIVYMSPVASVENVMIKPTKEPVVGEAITEEELAQLMQCINNHSLPEASRELLLKQLYED